MSKGLIITALVFFLLVNTSSYWAEKLGFFGMLPFLVLVIVFFGLVVALLRQIIFALKEKLTKKHRFFTISLLTAVLCLTYFFPFGLINLQRLSRNDLDGNDLLIAQREGAANCMTTLKLKDNNTFTERDVCFGVTNIRGNYKILHDTIHFENVDLGKFCNFAVIRRSKSNTDTTHFNLIMFRDFGNGSTREIEFHIIKNELNKHPSGEFCRTSLCRPADFVAPARSLQTANSHLRRKRF